MSALALVQKIRAEYFEGRREAEFMCVCDINKESKDVIEELNFAQVCRKWRAEAMLLLNLF